MEIPGYKPRKWSLLITGIADQLHIQGVKMRQVSQLEINGVHSESYWAMEHTWPIIDEMGVEVMYVDLELESMGIPFVRTDLYRITEDFDPSLKKDTLVMVVYDKLQENQMTYLIEKND